MLILVLFLKFLYKLGRLQTSEVFYLKRPRKRPRIGLTFCIYYSSFWLAHLEKKRTRVSSTPVQTSKRFAIAVDLRIFLNLKRILFLLRRVLHIGKRNCKHERQKDENLCKDGISPRRANPLSNKFIPFVALTPTP